MFPGEIEILKQLENIRNPFLNTLFEIITLLGEELVIIAFLAIVYFAFNKVVAKKIFFITATSINFNGVVKSLAKVPRPFATGEVTCLKESTATGYSFPSGHTQTIATWTTAGSIQLKKWWLFLITGIVICLVGLSRMYLGAHYLSDVLFGALFGITFAIGLSFIFDKVKNKVVLYSIVVGIFLPFIIYFMFSADPLYADTFKTFGITLGLFFVEWFEPKFVNMDNKTTWWKKIIRVVVAIILAMGSKELIKLTYSSCQIVEIILLMDAIRYFLVVIISFAFWPWVIKKLNL